MKLCYIARPMASYAIPGASMIPPILFDNLPYKLIDPAFDLELGEVRGKGMSPWTNFIERHCDAMIVVTSRNVWTAGVLAEYRAALRSGIEVHTPYSTVAGYPLTIEESVKYNSLGALTLPGGSKPPRFSGFLAVNGDFPDPSVPRITYGQYGNLC